MPPSTRLPHTCTRLMALLLVCSLVVCISRPVAAQTVNAPKSDPAQPAPVVIRVQTAPETQTPMALQLAILEYQHPQTRQRVDLIAAVHVADASYYALLNQRFKRYDALLYELVGEPADTTEQPHTTDQQAETASEQPQLLLGGISAMQGWLQRTLELEHQLNLIDYQASNFIHADLRPTELRQQLADNNSSLLQEIFGNWRQQLVHSLLYPQDNISSELLLAWFASDRAKKLKRLLARQFVQQLSMPDYFHNADQLAANSTLIGARNQRAIEVLQQQLPARKPLVGIFYGAAHIDDLHQRLLTQLGFAYQQQQWPTAWQLD